MPKSESETVVWTGEMGEAFGVAVPLMDRGDMVAARMAFKEKYLRLVSEARDSGKPVVWSATLGHDVTGRSGPITDAVEKGRLSLTVAKGLCYEVEITPDMEKLASQTLKGIGNA